eukprot:15353628-Ditylum_brightwellii.AAC.1
MSVGLNDNHDDEEEEDNIDHVLVCTDWSTRGGDFNSFPINHDMLFNFLHDPAEYVHWVGGTSHVGHD